MAHEPPAKPATASPLHGIAELFRGHFPGHTMQRVRTPDGRYRYTYVSPGVRETFGLDPDALRDPAGVSHEWLPPEDRERFLAALERSAATLEPLDEEVRVRRPDGQVRWVRSIGQPRRLPDGSVAWDGVALDVTDRHEAQAALAGVLDAARRAEASERSLLAVGARDMRDPLRRLDAAIGALEATARPAQRHAIAAARAAADELAVALEATLGLVGAVDPVAEGAPPPAAPPPKAGPGAGLTERQRGVLALVGAGLTNREIAARLAIAEGTAKLHVSAAMRRIGARNRTEAARLFAGA